MSRSPKDQYKFSLCDGVCVSMNETYNLVDAFFWVVVAGLSGGGLFSVDSALFFSPFSTDSDITKFPKLWRERVRARKRVTN